MTGGGVSYLGTAASMTVGRVSFALGLEGPTIPVELNCASSLVAVHYAVAALRQGEVDLALAAGAHAVLSPELTREMAELGLLSASGRCRAFDAAADGFVRGEGCGVVLLKRLSEAEADGDRIWGVIRGSAVNQNGAAAGPTVPNGPAQERVIEEALARGSVVPEEVDYLEAHGAGVRVRGPDRGAGGRSGIRQGTRSGPPAVDRLGEDQHRTPGAGCRGGEPDQDRAGDEAGDYSAEPAL